MLIVVNVVSHLFRFVEVLEFFGARSVKEKMEKRGGAGLVRLCGEVEETLPSPEPASISRLQHTGSSSGCARRAPWCNGGGGGCITLFNSIALISVIMALPSCR